ncbi:MaoC family dehydratase [Natrinema halophilum]|uniref:MaoC family dehydratase n=1 Tax=Natrinema halophilum TaxID=1699371 RepID=A0A7D5KB36_9EURY|nr:MaoC family dehydratase [Natrinema halophilum]QLG47516.1 MaoC family dehydratase [Natrinema halophilum]
MSSKCSDTDSNDSGSTTTHWTSISKHVVNSYVEANNAFLAAIGMSPSYSDAPNSQPEPTTTTSSSVDEVAFGDETWVLERSTDNHDALGVGDYVRFSKPIVESDVTAFSQISGDTNRLHLEPGFAEGTRFGDRIAHGTLVAGTISAALARLPGTTIYLSQDLEFTGPVEIGETVTAECEIVETLGGDRYRLHTMVVDQDNETVVDGEAVVIINAPPAE